MKVVEIKDISRKDVPIYYRRVYSGTAVLEILNKKQEVPVEFLIENTPFGTTMINVTFNDKVDYPMVPLQKELKNFITAMDAEGKLTV